MPKNLPPTVDGHALKTLFTTYWSSAGWRSESECRTPLGDFEHAKQAGLMFDPITLSHSQVVRQTIAAVRAVDRKTVADAFVVSLSSHRLDLRSALGSFAVMQHLPQHKGPKGLHVCPLCGEWDDDQPRDHNILNFERFKWGGVRHDQPEYASLDLRLFQAAPAVGPDRSDVAVLKSVLKAIQSAPRSTTSAALEKQLAKTFKSNKAERDTVVAILGYCGVFVTTDHTGYLDRFVPSSERALPDRRFVDMPYPACWWQRSDEVNEDALNYWFGHLL
jgi:hypothetical protein